MVSHFKLAATKQHIARRLGKQGSRALDENWRNFCRGGWSKRDPISIVFLTTDNRDNSQRGISTFHAFFLPHLRYRAFFPRYRTNRTARRSEESRFHPSNTERKNTQEVEKMTKVHVYIASRWRCTRSCNLRVMRAIKTVSRAARP